jgi:primosomal protein N' (replication factor Y)
MKPFMQLSRAKNINLMTYTKAMTSSETYYLVEPTSYTGRSSGFTYTGPQGLSDGQLVVVPLGRKQQLGIIRSTHTEKPDFPTKEISKILDVPPLPNYLLALGDWISQYYAASPSSVWTAMLPAGITKKRRPITLKSPKKGQGLSELVLTAEQDTALQGIRLHPDGVTLIQGVTGSGKTRIYQELAAEAIAANRSVILLVPEITLTPQIMGQFETVFGDIVLATHSKLTETARDSIWRTAIAATTEGLARIAIGPRSNLFLPLHNIGLIIIDESHETTYKQEQNPRYDAIIVARKLATLTNARYILGSATPGLREVQLAKNGRIEQQILKFKANNQPHTEAIILDLRTKELFKKSKFITQPLLDALTETLALGRQSLLYINRRGSASAQICSDCGYVSNCPDCRLPLTFHGDTLKLICHHCGYQATSPAVCPECKGLLRYIGGGTKRIEAELSTLFPEARIARLDRDSATLEHLTAVYAGLNAGTIDIVIGTQMIAKGLDFPALDTVGIVSADTMLYLPDFGASERTFNLLSQVSGRAGRGDRPGQVFIQTYTPDHPAIQAAAHNDFWGFVERELEIRKELSYPPFVYLLKLTFSEGTDESARSRATHLAQQLRQVKGLDVSGPAPAFMAYSGGKYHWMVTIKALQRPPLVEIARQLPDSVTADLDPVNLL